VAVIIDALAECVREPSEPSHAHSHSQVVAFNVGRADVPQGCVRTRDGALLASLAMLLLLHGFAESARSCALMKYHLPAAIDQFPNRASDRLALDNAVNHENDFGG
jgi:hypothetical protein